MLVPPAPTAAATLATAATLTQDTLPPHPPITTTFATPVAELMLRRRATYTSDSFSLDQACMDYIDALPCGLVIDSCLSSLESMYYTYTGTDPAVYASYSSGVSACDCSYGLQYLTCYYNALENSVCSSYLSGNDWKSEGSSIYLEYCGTVSSTVDTDTSDSDVAVWTMTGTEPPSVVSLDLQSVKVITVTTNAPSAKGGVTTRLPPIYDGTGGLLRGECASTQFTLIEDFSTVYWAAYVGCASNQPQCCPWTAASDAIATTVTVTSTLKADDGGGVTATGINVIINAFPVPANSEQSVLKRCASDYYSILGQCCPSSYWPFTRNLGGQTPCYSVLPVVTEAPTLTDGLVKLPTATEKPTWAVINVVWSMSYPVESESESEAGVSKGAVAGISVAVVVVMAALVALSLFLFRARRKNKALMQQKQNQNQQSPSPPGIPSSDATQPMPNVQPRQDDVSPTTGVAVDPLLNDHRKPQTASEAQPSVGDGYSVLQPQPQRQWNQWSGFLQHTQQSYDQCNSSISGRGSIPAIHSQYHGQVPAFHEASDGNPGLSSYTKMPSPLSTTPSLDHPVGPLPP